MLLRENFEIQHFHFFPASTVSVSDNFSSPHGDSWWGRGKWVEVTVGMSPDSHCQDHCPDSLHNTFEDRAPIDFIYIRCPNFQKNCKGDVYKTMCGTALAALATAARRHAPFHWVKVKQSKSKTGGTKTGGTKEAPLFTFFAQIPPYENIGAIVVTF